MTQIRKEGYTNLDQKYKTLKNTIVGFNNLSLPNTLLIGVIVMEDKRFYEHWGFDVHAIIRAFKHNLKSNYLQGASTIEQQLVRTLTNQRQISHKRKLVEILFATLISNSFTKNKLLCIYLNVYPFRSSKGVYELCKNENYDLNNLTVYDVSEIVARIKFLLINTSNYLRYLKRVRTTQIKIP